MSCLRLHPESHLVSRIGWLSAAVLGANDGIISTASLIVGVAAAAATRNDVSPLSPRNRHCVPQLDQIPIAASALLSEVENLPKATPDD